MKPADMDSSQPPNEHGAARETLQFTQPVEVKACIILKHHLNNFVQKTLILFHFPSEVNTLWHFIKN